MAKVIIYDKDGTLMKFDPFWVPVARHALARIFSEAVGDERLAEKLTEKTEKLAGIEGETASPEGILSSGTYSQCADVVSSVLKDAGVEHVVTKNQVETAMSEAVKYGKTLPCRENLRKTLLKAKKYAKLFVITTDEPTITGICLKTLKIDDLFEKVYCDDGICPHKPDPFAAGEIEKLTGADKSEIYMVGDTATDCNFAANAGINFVSVGKCSSILGKAVYNASDAVDATEYILSRFACDESAR